MREVVGDLWTWHGLGAVVAVTTGGAVDRHGCAQMPRGCARQARERFPSLAWTLGGLLRQHGNHVFDLGHRVVSFPVENSPFEVPDLQLIRQSCRELVALADYKGWAEIIVPRPGCGGGGLSWTDVRPILLAQFDERFGVITTGAGTVLSSEC